MARVFSQSEAKRLDLPGRKSMELVSGASGTSSATVRLVEIAVPAAGDAPRARHSHKDFEECIYVLSGQGETSAESGEHRIHSGDLLWIPAGEAHVTRNTGMEPLVLLCFFPSADVSAGTSEQRLASRSAEG